MVNGHLFILETPLFKIRTKDQTHYCFSEDEKEQVLKSLGNKSVEMTRFKGLGEISPKEFKQFIAEDIRLKPITISNFSDIKNSLDFYMGKNTPQRREFIMENLITDLGVL